MILRTKHKTVAIIGLSSDSVFHFQCVFSVDKENGLTLVEIADGVTIEDVVSSTGCLFKVAENLKPMGQIEVADE